MDNFKASLSIIVTYLHVFLRKIKCNILEGYTSACGAKKPLHGGYSISFKPVEYNKNFPSNNHYW